MNKYQATESTETPQSIDAYIERYTPERDLSGQWELHREQIVSLVKENSPYSIDKATNLLSSLSHLLVEAAERNFTGELPDLLNEEGIQRVVARMQRDGYSLGSQQTARKNLSDLHRQLNQLPPALPGPRQQRKASDPVLRAELAEIEKLMRKPKSAVHLHVRRRLILALGAGLVGDKADGARIFHSEKGITAIVDANGRRRPLTKKWISDLNELVLIDLELYKIPDKQGMQEWLRTNKLSYLWPRLRDEWLLEQLNGQEPAFVQFRRAGVTEYDLNRITLRWQQIPLMNKNNSLRNRTIYRQIECEAVTSAHSSSQLPNDGRLDKESGNAMQAKTRGKISKAQARRESIEHAHTVSAITHSIPAYHQKIMNEYTCKAATPGNRAVVHAAFVTVMERTSHILSVELFRKVCSDVSALTAWAASMGRDLTWTSLMTHALIDDYARVEKKQGNTASLSQRYRRLKCLASKLNPGVGAPPRVAPVGHKAVSDPYSADEMAAILRVANNQQSESVTRQLAFILGACRGAGASVSELRDLRGKNVEDRGENGIFITLGEGERKRTIPVRREWEDLMRRGILGLAPSDLAIGSVRNRKNIAGEIVDRTVSLGTSTPHIEASRLRTTWIAELMSEAIPVQVILHAAGLRGARTLTDLARRYSQDEINSKFGVLRGVNS